MLDRINIKNILYSFVIGALIGLVAQIALNPLPDLKSLFLCIVLSGMIGLFIGTVIDFVMALLPVKYARPSIYFIINNLIALFITLAVIMLLYYYSNENLTAADLRIILAIAFVIIVAANILDVFRYKRTNTKLKEYIEKKISLNKSDL